MAKKRNNSKKVAEDSKKLNDWLTNFSNVNTRRRYETLINNFVEYIKIEDLDKYVQDTRRMTDPDKKIEYLDSLERDITKYWNYLNESTHGKTPYPFLSAIKMFLTYSKTFELDHLWLSLRRNGHGDHSVTDFDTLTKEQLRKILTNADAEAKAIIMIIKDCGQRPGRVLNLTWDEIDLNHDYPRLIFRNTKTKKMIKTRVTPETKEAILDYIEQRDKFIATRKLRGARNRQNPLDENKLFPMDSGTIRQIWRTLCKKQGLYILDPVTNKPKYGLHSLRRFFKDNFTSERWADIFTGHISARDREYRLSLKNDKKLDEKYKEHSQNLYINWKIEDEKIFEEHEQKLQELTHQLKESQGSIELLNTQIEILQNRNQEKQSHEDGQIQGIAYLMNHPQLLKRLAIDYQKTRQPPMEELEKIARREFGNIDSKEAKQSLFKDLRKTKEGRKILKKYGKIFD